MLSLNNSTISAYNFRRRIIELQADTPSIAAALAASLVAVDGVIEDQERVVAVQLGNRMLSGFSPTLFETLLDGLTELPAAYELASMLKDMVEEEEKDRIMDYLVAVATADDMVVEVERQELVAVAEALGVPMPPLPAIEDPGDGYGA